MKDLLRVAMTPLRFPFGTVYTPRTWVRLVRGNTMSRRLRALVDTGAYQTVVSRAVATELGFSAAELAALPTTQVGGLGDLQQDVCEARVDLHVGPGAPELLTLRDARVFFVRQLVADYEVLLGQCDALERLTLVQRNHPPERELVLRFPSTPR